MMPLWTTTQRPRLTWGWAFSAEGTPWVAQRVWATPRVPGRGVCVHLFPQALDLAQGTDAAQVAGGGQGGHAGGVVAAVFEAPQPLEQDGRDLTLGDAADDSAHAIGLSNSAFGL